MCYYDNFEEENKKIYKLTNQLHKVDSNKKDYFTEEQSELFFETFETMEELECNFIPNVIDNVLILRSDEDADHCLTIIKLDEDNFVMNYWLDEKVYNDDYFNDIRFFSMTITDNQFESAMAACWDKYKSSY